MTVFCYGIPYSIYGIMYRNTYGVTGYCPATVLRKSVISSDQPQTSFSSYENEKDLYQELNIHKPPPRR